MEELRLFPVNDECLAKVDNVLKRNKMFYSVEQFIDMYNKGILSQNSEVVKDFAELISNSYKNINISNRKLIVETASEFACQNAIELLNSWKAIIKLKRIATNIFNEEYPVDTKIVFDKEKEGIPQIETFEVSQDSETGELIKIPILTTHWSSERIVSRNEILARNIFTKNILKTYNNDEDSCYFLIEDLVDIDDSFMLEVEKIILSNTFLEK